VAGSVKVWDLAAVNTKATVRVLPVGPGSHATFSPDGAWLATATLNGGCRLWRVGTWEPGLEVGGNHPLFGPDGRTLVTETGHGELKLTAVATGAEVARLAPPFPTRMYPLCFSPDGARLVAWGKDSGALHVWELGALRALLGEHGLEWERP
jgi:WD40 repeat protein